MINRLKNKDLRLKFFSVLISLFIIHYSLFLNPIFAATSTPSASPAKSATAEASLKTKLDELKKEIASKAAILKKDVDKRLVNKAYIGKIKTKSNATITLATKLGPRIVNLNQDTVFESSVKGKKFTQKLMAQEDFVATLGDIDETDVLTAKKVVLLPPSPEATKSALWGKVASVSDKLTTIADRAGKTISVSLPDIRAVKLNDFVILSGRVNKDSIFEADFVYIIPQSGISKPKDASASATPSATPKGKIATSSAKPKATPTPKSTSR